MHIAVPFFLLVNFVVTYGKRIVVKQITHSVTVYTRATNIRYVSSEISKVNIKIRAERGLKIQNYYRRPFTGN